MKKRAMKKWIPKNTLYCYEFVSLNENGYGYKVKPCKWFKRVCDKETGEKVAWCLYTRCVDGMLLSDQCKECGVGTG